ncbi:lytic transglycosylase domain-containing protein [Klebsiella variicola]|uniref:lytic transglycosylase domain-containing protein n=1 Tax=Klebsiella variicola TaxID=244366 RepID=UPI0034DE65E1
MIDLDTLYEEQNNKAASNGSLSLDALYSGNEQKTQGSLDALYTGNITPDEKGNINLEAIEEIESAGKNSATSSTGAKGLYQFMPGTAAQYSKRLFGKAVSDASTLSPEQQKQMANAYFADLLKEFNGNVDEAVAAYNWGQGNVEKDIAKNGSDWENHLPEETANYLKKYHKLSHYDHSSNKDMSSGEYMANQWQQIKDLSKGGYAEAKKLLGMDYNEDDIEEAQSALNTDAGKDLKKETAIAASIVAPEAIPEMVGFEGAGLASWLGKGLASSVAYQGVDKGDVSLKDTAIDLATGAATEKALGVLAKPAMKQITKAFNALSESGEATPELTDAVKRYLGAARAEELGKNWKELRETDPQATLLDAYQYMAEQVPGVWESGSIEDVKPFVRSFKNNGSHTALINSANSQKRLAYDEAKELAKTDAQRRLISDIAEANEQGSIHINNDVLDSTPLQKVGETTGEYLGFGKPKFIAQKQAREALKPEADEMLKRLNSDNSRIGRELKKLNGKSGASITAKVNALGKQRTANNKMKQFITEGMKGKKVNIADIQTAIKEVQEEQFSSNKFKGITQDFKKLQNKFDAMQALKVERDEGLINTAMKHYLPHAVGKVVGVGALPLGITATAAGKVAKASKAANLQFARDLVKAVESGAMSEEEAEKAITERVSKSAKLGGRLSTSLRESVQ